MALRFSTGSLIDGRWHDLALTFPIDLGSMMAARLSCTDEQSIPRCDTCPYVRPCAYLTILPHSRGKRTASASSHIIAGTLGRLLTLKNLMGSLE
jgi:hypothetical protein